MSNPAISHNDLFDFDSYSKAIEICNASTVALEMQLSKVATIVNKNLSEAMSTLSDTKIEIANAKDVKTLESIDKKLTELSASITNYRNTSKGVDKINFMIADSLEAINTKAKDAKKKYEALSEEQRKNEKVGGVYIKQMVEAKTASQQFTEEVKAATKSISTIQGSYKQMSDKLATIKNELKNLPHAFDETTGKINKSNKAAVDYATQIAELDKSLKMMDASMGEFGRNVGNYEGGFKGIVDKLEEMPGATGGAIQGIKSLGAQFTKLLANPVVLFITLIVGGLALLFNMFKKTQTGVEFMQKAGAALNGVMNTLIGIVNNVSKALSKAFSDPKKAISDLWEAIKTNVVNRFKGLVDLLAIVGKSFNALASHDLGALKQAAKDAGTALIQMGSGMDANQQKKFSQALSDIAKKAAEAAKAFYALEEAKIAYQKATRETEKEIEKLITTEELNKAIADDATKSFTVRENAAEKSRVALEAKAKKEMNIAKGNLDLINQELKLRQANGENVQELLDKQLEAYKQYAGAEREYTLAVRDNEKQRSELKQDRLEKDLDILIDGFDNQKTVNEQLLSDTRLTLKARETLLEKTRKLSDESFKRQGDTIQQFTQKQIDYNDLLATSDAELLRQKIRSYGLSEIIEGRLLEIIREKRTANQDFYNDEKTLSEERLKREQDGEVARMQLKIEDLKTMGLEYATEEKKLLDYQKNIELSVTGQTEQERLNIIEKYRQKEEETKRGQKTGKINTVHDDYKKLANEQIALNNLTLASTDSTSEQKAAALKNNQDLQFKLIDNEDLRITKLHNERLIGEKEYQDALQQLNIDRINAQTEAETKAKEQKQALQDEYFSTTSQAVSAFNDIYANYSDARQTQLQNEMTAAENSVGDNANAKARIEAEYQKKINKEKRKAAIIEKATALFSIGLNVAKGVMAAMSTPLTVWMVPWIMAQGAIEAAVVAAKPIPQYRRGRKNGPEEMAIVNDQPGNTFREMIVSQHKAFIPTKRNQLVHLNRGDKVIPAIDTAMIMRTMEMQKLSHSHELHRDMAIKLEEGRKLEIQHNLTQALMASRVNEDYLIKGIGRELSSLPIEQNIYDERGYRKRQKRISDLDDYLRKKNSL